LEIKHINDTLDKYYDKLVIELSKHPHEDISWISAKDGEVVDYESVFYRTDVTSVRLESMNIKSISYSQTSEFNKDFKKFLKRFMTLEKILKL
jgi:hypothetical protein